MSSDLPSGTVTFLFTDIEGSTELSRRHGAAFGELRAEHRRVLRETFVEHHGHVVDAEGDAFFVAFERASDAVAAGVAAQRALRDDVVRARMGIHTTEPHRHDDGYFGVGVSRASRICAAAHGGQLLLSHATAGIIADQDLSGLSLRDLGEHALKDIPHPERLFQVDVEDLPAEFPPVGVRGVAGTVATLLCTDLSGWQRVMRELGDDEAAAAGVRYHRIVGKITREHDGHVVELIADNAMCLFSSAREAVVAASEICDAIDTEEWIAGTERPQIHAGVDTGRLAGMTAGQLGSLAHRVSVLCSVAEAGQILVSHACRAMLVGERLDGLELHDLGDRELPGLEPSRVYELVTTRSA